MKNIPNVLKMMTQFGLLDFDGYEEFCSKNEFPFNKQNVESALHGEPDKLQLTDIDSLAQYLDVSYSFLLTGTPTINELYSLSDIGKGRTISYISKPFFEPLVRYLCVFEPALAMENMDWTTPEQRGYSKGYTLHKSLTNTVCTYPKYNVTIDGVVVGQSDSEAGAAWLESRMNACMKQLKLSSEAPKICSFENTSFNGQRGADVMISDAKHTAAVNVWVDKIEESDHRIFITHNNEQELLVISVSTNEYVQPKVTKQDNLCAVVFANYRVHINVADEGLVIDVIENLKVDQDEVIDSTYLFWNELFEQED